MVLHRLHIFACLASAEESLNLLQFAASKQNAEVSVDDPFGIKEKWGGQTISGKYWGEPIPDWAVERVGGGIPSGCRPKLLGENKKCAKKGTWMSSPFEVIPKADNYWGWSSQGNGVWRYVNDTFKEQGIVGAWAAVQRGHTQGCCSTRFQLFDQGDKWAVKCEIYTYATNPDGSYIKKADGSNAEESLDSCAELEDSPGSYVFDAGTESCGIADKSPEVVGRQCTIRHYGLAEGCKPNLVKENTRCDTPNLVGKLSQGWWNIGRADTVEECMVLLFKDQANCCGMRFDFNPRLKQCGCARRIAQPNWWCQDERFVPAKSDAPETAVYDASHCYTNPHNLECPIDPGYYKADPCKKLLTVDLNKPQISNLGGQGPDAGDEGMLFADAAGSNGQSLDLKVSAPGLKSHKPAKNSAAGGLGTINLKAGKNGSSAELTFALVTKDGASVELEAFAITFLDLDEAKRGKCRTTLTACGADKLTAGAELSTSVVDQCQTVASSMFGTAANNPESLDGLTDNHKLRAATFMFPKGTEFKVKMDLSKGPGGRNLLFAIAPVLGCE